MYIFGYKLLKEDFKTRLKKIYLNSKASQYEVNFDREELVNQYGKKTIKFFVDKIRSDFDEKIILELITLLKEEQYLKDDAFYANFTINLQRKMRSGFLLNDIKKIKDASIENIIPFYNKQAGFFGLKIDCKDRAVYVRFHGEMPSRNSMTINRKISDGEDIIEVPYVDAVITSKTQNAVNNPQKTPGELEVEIH